MPLTIFLASLAFMHRVIPEGVTEPYLFGMPRTLWISMLISLSIYVVLVIAMVTSEKN